ncbi:hypothetical protein DSUL_40034 [Desulfovibrionales bacterium]
MYRDDCRHHGTRKCELLIFLRGRINIVLQAFYLFGIVAVLNNMVLRLWLADQ